MAQAGAMVLPAMEQGRFLRAMGLEARTEALARGVGTKQRLEQLHQVLGRHTWCAVGHGDDQRASLNAPAQTYLSRRMGVAQAVFQQVGQQLLDTAAIPAHARIGAGLQDPEATRAQRRRRTDLDEIQAAEIVRPGQPDGPPRSLGPLHERPAVDLVELRCERRQTRESGPDSRLRQDLGDRFTRPPARLDGNLGQTFAHERSEPSLLARNVGRRAAARG